MLTSATSRMRLSPADPIKSPTGWKVNKGRQCAKGKGEERNETNTSNKSTSLSFVSRRLGGEGRVEVCVGEFHGDAVLQEVNGRGVGNVQGTRNPSPGGEEAADTSAAVDDD